MRGADESWINTVNVEENSRSGAALATRLQDAAGRWRDAGRPTPDALLVTGSGLGLQVGKRLAEPWPFAELLPFEVEAIEGHAVSAEMVSTGNGLRLLHCRGRLHAYQGYSPAQVVFLVRLAALLGARLLIVTNAAGSLREELPVGSLAVISDHINLTGLNPLRGRLPKDWGPQFPDLADAYDPDLRRRLCELAAKAGMTLGEGVYLGLLGPSFETPAEVRAFRGMGADLVGMSTVLEVIAARHMGMRVLGLSLVTNMAVGLADDPIDHEDVLRTGREASPGVARLLAELLADDALAAAGGEVARA